MSQPSEAMPLATKKLGRRSRRILWLGMAAVTALGTHVGLEAYRSHHHAADFAAERGRLVAVEEERVDETERGVIHSIRLESDRGDVVHARLRTQPFADRPLPTVVILAGLRTGSSAVDIVADEGQVNLLALDYPYPGKRSRLNAIEFVTALPAMHRAILRTVPATMMAVDYLLTRPDVDPDHIIFVGGSLGALFGPALAASDPRVAAVALMLGAGDLGTLIAANVPGPGLVAHAAGWLGSFLVAPIEPLKYVGDISPRPTLVIAAADDERIPEACTHALYEAAREPKTIRWIPTRHESMRSMQFQSLILAELSTWLVDQKLIDPPAGQRGEIHSPAIRSRAEVSSWDRSAGG